jgi:hypothetical protein
MTRSRSKGEGSAVMNVRRIVKFGLKEERLNDRGFKLLIIHRGVEGF